MTRDDSDAVLVPVRRGRDVAPTASSRSDRVCQTLELVLLVTDTSGYRPRTERSASSSR